GRHGGSRAQTRRLTTSGRAATRPARCGRALLPRVVGLAPSRGRLIVERIVECLRRVAPGEPLGRVENATRGDQLDSQSRPPLGQRFVLPLTTGCKANSRFAEDRRIQDLRRAASVHFGTLASGPPTLAPSIAGLTGAERSRTKVAGSGDDSLPRPVAPARARPAPRAARPRLTPGR